MTEKEKFLEYLSNATRSNGKAYKSSTINTYGDSISLITEDLNINLKLNITSLFDVEDVSQLENLYGNLYSLPHIKQQEQIQRKRKTNAFNRYIEFRRSNDEINLNQNQPDLADIEQSRTEGGKRVVISLMAERDTSFRKLAILIHGTNCFGCGFNFTEKYGELGEGFIEIHHAMPLSKNLEPVATDPKTDLIPLCSNCHRMVHRKRSYVMSLQELRNIINSNNF